MSVPRPAMVAALTFCGALPVSAWAVAPRVSRASLSSSGQATGPEVGVPPTSSNARISANGRYAVFETDAPLVSGDADKVSDVYRRDVVAGTTELVSVTAGTPGTISGQGPSHTPAVSEDGRYVVFASLASNLTALAPGPGTHVRDMTKHTTTRVDVLPGVTPGFWVTTGPAWWYPAISADGGHVAFVSGAPELTDKGRRQVFVRDMASGAIEVASVDAAGVEGSLPSMYPSLSDDGSRVSFATASSLLATGADSNGVTDVYVRDTGTGPATTTRVSVTDSGAQSQGGSSSWPSISGDGRAVAFISSAGNLATGVTGVQQNVYVRTAAGRTVCASVGPAGAESVHGASYHPSLSHGGRYVSFQSADDELMGDHTWGALFVRDLNAGGTLRRVGAEATVTAGGSLTPASGVAESCTSMSADGRYVVFDSSATDLVTGDTNLGRDVFVVDLRPQVRATLSRPKLSVTSPFKNRYFYVSGTVTRHSAKASVRLYFYRQVGSSYRYYKYFKVSTSRSYKVRLRLPRSGDWSVVAKHLADAGHLKSSSASRTFRVR